MRWTRFARSHYKEYLSWYDDPELDRWLGPMDEEWLEAVLTEKDGIQFSIFNAEELVAVLGLKYGTSEHPDTVITDIAIQPSQRRAGIGSQVLKELPDQVLDVHRVSWTVFVDPKNHKTLSFFKKHNWVQNYEEQQTDNMIQLKPNSLT